MAFFSNSTVFGAPQQPAATLGSSGGLFGNSGSSGGTPGLFGGTQNSSPFNFGGNSSTTPSSMFASSGLNLFGGGQQQQQAAGTCIPFKPKRYTETAAVNGVNRQIITNMQTITCMDEYGGNEKSLEELRVEDYQLGRHKKPPQSLTLVPATATTSPTQFNFSTVFGGAPTTTAAPTFRTMTSTNNTAFGGTGGNLTFSGLFANTAHPNPAFGFGTTSTSQPTGTFGSTLGTGTGFFSASPAAGAFGGNTGAFGAQKPASSTPSLFGTTTTTTPQINPFTPAATQAPAFGNTFGTAPTTTTAAQTPWATSLAATSSQPSSFFGSSTATKPIFNFGTNTTPPLFGTPKAIESAPVPSFGMSKPSPFCFGQASASTQPVLQQALGAQQQFRPFGNSSIVSPDVASLGQNVLSGLAWQLTPTGFVPMLPTYVAPLASVSFATSPVRDIPLFYNLPPTPKRSETRMTHQKLTPPLDHSSLPTYSRASRPSTTLSASSAVVNSRTSINRSFPSNISFFSSPEENPENDSGHGIDLLTPKCQSVKSLDYSIVNQLHAQDHSESPLEPSFQLSQTPPSTDLRERQQRTKMTLQSILSPQLEREGDQSLSPHHLVESNCSEPVRAVRYSQSSCGAVSTRGDYFTVPPLDELDIKTDQDGNCLVCGFLVGRKNYGAIKFLTPVNLKGIDIDKTVFFRHKELEMYPNDAAKPQPGLGLNCPAEVTLQRVWPMDRQTHELIRTPTHPKVVNYEAKLKRACERMGSQFVSYSAENGLWTFLVNQF